MELKGYNYNLGLLFYQVTENNLNKTAINREDNNGLSFGDLNLLSNQIARYLLSKGLIKGSVIAIFNDKSITAYSLMIACLKVGIIYTNLDIASPWARLQKILFNCKPDLVCLDKEDLDIENNIGALLIGSQIINLNNSAFDDQLAVFEKSNLPESVFVHGSDPAYIMFTSGSTGFPKGAVMSHQNLINFIRWGKETFSVTTEDIFTNANPIYFDNSVFDFYVSIFNGASLVPLSIEIVKQPRLLIEKINKVGCTIWFSVPSLLVYLLSTKSLKKEDFPLVTRISFGGEGFPKNKLKQLFELFGDRIDLYNVYGPTECTCICSSYKISDVDFENMNELAPLGFISPNFGYEILPLGEDENLGELCLAGPCVGLGYYKDDDRTNKSFIQNPQVPYLQTIYRTGDLVEKARNGHLNFKGRVDNQIKHMGYRIELEEIEAAFSSLPYIDEVGVIYERINAELGQIKVFIRVNNTDILQASILDDVKLIVPPYMVPRIVTILPELPKNQNGKIDRNQLKEIK